MPLFSRGSSASLSYRPPESPVSWRTPTTVTSTQEGGDEETTALPQLRRSLSSHRSSIFGIHAVSRITDASQRMFLSSPVSRAASVASSRASSKDASSVLNQESGHPLSFAKSLLMRGKQLKRSASKLSLASTLNDSERPHASSPSPMYCTTHGPDGQCDCKFISGQGFTSISSPFEFKHVTHSHPKHFRNLDRTNENDLVAEFSAVRAAQRSKPDLRGIKAEALHSRNSSGDTRLGSPYTSGATSPHLSAVPSLTSEQSQDSLQASPMSSQPNRSAGRGPRSRESFSQPFIAARFPRIGDGPLTPPPRISSRGAFTADHRATKSKESVSSGHSDHSRTSSESHRYFAPGISHYVAPPPAEAPESLDKNNVPLDASESTIEPPPSYTFTFSGMLSPVSEEDTSTLVSRSSYTSQVICDESSSEDAIIPISNRVSAARSDSQTSVCTIVFAPSQTATQASERYEGTKPAANGPPPCYSRRSSIRRSSTSNGLFSSWEDDTDLSDNSGTDVKLALEKNHNVHNKRNTVILLRNGQTDQLSPKDSLDATKHANKTIAETERNMANAPTRSSHKRKKSNPKIDNQVYQPVRNRKGPPSAPPRSKLPTIPKNPAARPTTPTSPSSASHVGRRSKIPVKQESASCSELLHPILKQPGVPRLKAMDIHEVGDKIHSYASENALPKRSLSDKARKRTTSETSLKRPSTASKSAIPVLETSSALPLPHPSNHLVNNSTYMVFPSASKSSVSSA